MNYQETLNWLYSQFPVYQRDGETAYKKDINNVRDFFHKNGTDYLSFNSIHIGGTNGKGSVSHMLSSIFQEAGYKVGIFTSPHIVDFRERIKINNNKISSAFITSFINDNQRLFDALDMSFFEMNVAMAFRYFSVEKVDIAIIEVGLGGRLDATNIIHPVLSIITNVSLDHINILGGSLDLITKEKAGIIKENTPVLIGKKNEFTRIFEERAVELNASIYYSELYKYATDLKGSFQSENINTTVTAINIVNKLNFEVSEENIEFGLQKVVCNTDLIGRWQNIKEKPSVICDIAHNIDAIKIIFLQFSKIQSKKHVIIGFSNDKQVELMVENLPNDVNYYICGSSNRRTMNVNELAQVFKKNNLSYKKFIFSFNAYNYLINRIDEHETILITGSTFIVSDILKYLDKV